MTFRLDAGPFDRLGELYELASRHERSVVDLTIGEPGDDPPGFVVSPINDLTLWRRYPASIGSDDYLQAAAAMMQRRFSVEVPLESFGAAIGSKEFIAGLPQWLKLWMDQRDTVLYPAVSYPTYAVGAKLAGCRAVPVPLNDRWQLDLDRIEPGDARRALCLWSNTPGNPAGGLDDLRALAEWGRANDVLVVSDECYAEFTWSGDRHTILESGTEGVLALHSLSKRSNLAGLRAAFYAGDEQIVASLRDVRRHAGLMIPGPIQKAATAVLVDDAHVDSQRELYFNRMTRLVDVLRRTGVDLNFPGGGFFAWGRAPGGDGWDFARRLAEQAGAVVVPGEFYGETSKSFVRASAVEPEERIEMIASRWG